MGQTMLTIGALVLLGLTVFSVNSNNLQHGVILNQTEIGVYAVSLATSYIQTASELNFDQKTIPPAGAPIPVDASGTRLVAPTTTNLTAYTLLGCDGGTEVVNDERTFNDFDDFNGFAKLDTIRGVDRFMTLGKVYYIDPTSPDIAIPGPTFFKRLDIRTYGTVGRGVFEVSGVNAASQGIDTIKLSYIFSYFR